MPAPGNEGRGPVSSSLQPDYASFDPTVLPFNKGLKRLAAKHGLFVPGPLRAVRWTRGELRSDLTTMAFI